MYLAYCDCRRPNGETMKIVACFTQGDADYLMVGRNGGFYDRRGRDWDAAIVNIVENPISIRQAFWAPYKKALRFVEDQIARFAQAKQKASDEHVETTAARVTDTATAGKPVAPAPVDVGRMVGIIAALGVGIGALGRSGRRSPSARRSRPARDAPSTILTRTRDPGAGPACSGSSSPRQLPRSAPPGISASGRSARRSGAGERPAPLGLLSSKSGPMPSPIS